MLSSPILARLMLQCLIAFFVVPGKSSEWSITYLHFTLEPHIQCIHFPRFSVGRRAWHMALCSRCSCRGRSTFHGDPRAGAGAWGAADGRGRQVLEAAPPGEGQAWPSGDGLLPSSLVELYPPSARCSSFQRPLKTPCGSLRSESFLTPTLSSYGKRSWPCTTSDSIMCCAGIGKTSTRLCATFTVASPLARPSYSARWVCRDLSYSCLGFCAGGAGHRVRCFLYIMVFNLQSNSE